METPLFSENCQSSWGGFGVCDPELSVATVCLQQVQFPTETWILFHPSWCLWKLMSHIRRKTPHGEWDHTEYLAVQICTWSIITVIDLVDKNDKWTVDKKKLQQTLYCKVVLKFWGICFEENVVYKEVSMSILDVLAAICVACSPTISDRWSECNWYRKDEANDGKSKQVFSVKCFQCLLWFAVGYYKCSV